MQSTIKRALVLSGGGARGAFQLGVWRYLQERGWDPDLICGTSVGGINAAAIGAGMPLKDLAQIWKTHHRGMMIRPQLLRFIASLLLRRPFRPVFDTAPLRAAIRRHLDIAALRRSRREILVAAVNLHTAQLSLFDHRVIGVDHLMATSAIPILFPWQRIDGQPFWDGCVAANTPLFAALQRGAREIVVVLLSPVGHRRLALPDDTVATAELALEHFLIGSCPTAELPLAGGREADADRARIYTVAPSRMLGFRSLLNFSNRQADRLIEEGYRNAHRQLTRLIE